MRRRVDLARRLLHRSKRNKMQEVPLPQGLIYLCVCLIWNAAADGIMHGDALIIRCQSRAFLCVSASVCTAFVNERKGSSRCVIQSGDINMWVQRLCFHAKRNILIQPVQLRQASLNLPFVCPLQDPDMHDVPEHFQPISEPFLIRNSEKSLG